MHRKSFRPLVLILSLLILSSLACQLGFDIPQEIGNFSDSSQDAIEVLQQPATGELFAEQDALVSLYETVSPGVVSIQVASDLGAGQGSGFVYDTQGHIVTNFHVVQGVTYMEVSFPSGERAIAEVVGVDADSDLAVIKVDMPASSLHPLPLGDSEQLKIGQTVIAIGNPFGLNGSMSTGIVSSMGRSLESLNEAPSGQAFSAGDLIQTDAAINPGNSGGPLLNLNGEVIGVNRAIRTFNTNETGNSLNSGVGFAVSVNIVKRVVPALIADGEYDYPYLGIQSLPALTLADAEQLGLDRTVGAFITDVVDGGPADEAGIETGDLIVGIDGRPVAVFDDLISYLFNHTGPGDTVELTVYRNGEEISIDLVLGARP